MKLTLLISIFTLLGLSEAKTSDRARPILTVRTYFKKDTIPEKLKEKFKTPNITSWDSIALQKQIALITKYIEQNPEKTAAYVKFSKKNIPYKVESLETFWESYDSESHDDDNYAESIYKVTKDDAGKVLALFEIPIRDSDSEISFEHYFDQNGKTFCFRIEADADTEDDHLVETIIEFYNKEFKQISRQRKFVNTNGKTLDRSKYASIIDFINIPYKPVSSLSLLIKKLRIDEGKLLTNTPTSNNQPIFYLGDEFNLDETKFELIGISSETKVRSYKFMGTLADKYFYGRQISDIIIGVKSGKIVTTIYNLFPEPTDVGIPNSIVELINKTLPYPLAFRDGIYGVNIDNTSISVSRTNNAMTFNKDRIMILTTIKQSILRQ